MNEADRTQRWLDELRSTLDTAADLVERGHDAYDKDLAVPLAFEALSNRIGDLAKRLVVADSERFSALIWRQAARHRDYVVHHYDRLDGELLWRTVTESFPELAALVRAEQQTG
ncbi:HepT-like ribonuclease domain-containing protein [Microbacterium sp. A82]|uniref:HepT-like ribonuclease domain-containing protein n=1 Tax=Microbacterium sp. A82 TaxID=3450452 RepID=UPI003F2D7941